MRLRKGVVAGAVLAIFAGAIAMLWLGRSPLMKRDAEATKAAVLAAIPLETPIPEIQSRMEAEGFTCERIKNGTYAAYPAGQRNPVSRGPADFLWCDYEAFVPFVLKRWQVIFEEEGGVVKEVSVSVGTTGL